MRSGESYLQLALVFLNALEILCQVVDANFPEVLIRSHPREYRSPNRHLPCAMTQAFLFCSGDGLLNASEWENAPVSFRDLREVRDFRL